MKISARPNNVDEYIAMFPEDTQTALNKIRAIIRKVAPKAEERISYGIAAYTLNGKSLIYFAGFKRHVSVYPKPRTPEWTKALAEYKGGKGTIQFPLDKPLPVVLITRVVRFNVEKNLQQNVGNK